MFLLLLQKISVAKHFSGIYLFFPECYTVIICFTGKGDIMKFDMHCHTQEGSLDGKIPLTEYVQLLKDHGFQGMLITDHNSYKAYQYYLENRDHPAFQDFIVLKGIEYDTLSCGHFLIIMPHDFHLALFDIRGLPLPLLLHLVHRFGGIIGPAHPFGEKFLSFGRSRMYRRHPEIVRKFDFLEGFNCCESREDNIRAVRLARHAGIPCFGGSDSHRQDNVGLAWTDFPVTIHTEDDLIRHIKLKGSTRIGGTFYHGTVKSRIGKWNDLLVYSYFFYNRFTALVRSRKLRSALKSARHRR